MTASVETRLKTYSVNNDFPQKKIYIPINQNGTMAKDALLLKKFISAVCVSYLRLEYELCGLATYASSPGCNRSLIGHYDLAAGNG